MAKLTLNLIERWSKSLLDGPSRLDSGAIRKSRALLILWTITTTVMWLYVLYCYLAYGFNTVTIGGLLLTTAHTTAPMFFQLTQSFAGTGVLISLTGLGFQVLFCLYSGGIFSPAAIWLTLHPVILAFFGNMLLIVASVTLNFFIVIGLYLIGIYNHLPIDTLPQAFRDGMIISSFIGLDILVASFTVVAIKINNDKTHELEKSKELVENLVRVLCHDINNPLVIIKFASSKMKKIIADPQSDKLHGIEEINQRITRASSQIEEITHSVRVWLANRDHKISLNKEIVTCSDVIEHLNFSFQVQLSAKNLKLESTGSNDDCKFYGDRTSVLFQVFNNLVSNAIKFSHANSKIEVNFTSDARKVYAKVRDHGVGIEENQIENVFSAYKQTSSVGTNNEKGTGFGLPIVKTIMEQMGGSVTIQNMGTLTHGKETGTLLTLTFEKVRS